MPEIASQSRPSRSRGETLRHLRGRLREWDPAGRASRGGESVARQPLPPWLAAGWRAGGVVELIGPEPAIWTLAGPMAGQEADSRVVLIESVPKAEGKSPHSPAEAATGQVFPGALALLGLSPERLLAVHPPNRRLTLWAAEQALRCGGVGVTLCRLGPRVGTTALRRLKLAAERGGGIGLICRPAAREPPFGDARIVVRPLASETAESLRPRLEVEVVYRRGRPIEKRRHVVELASDANLVPLLSPMAPPAGQGRPSGRGGEGESGRGGGRRERVLRRAG